MGGRGAKADDGLGQTVSVLDLDGDGNPELAIGTPADGSADGGAALNVLDGTLTGHITADSHLPRRGWAPDSGGTLAAGDRLGWSLR